MTTTHTEPKGKNGGKGAKPPVAQQEEGLSLEKESKHDAFRRLGKKRVNAACKRISLVGNLAEYEYTEDEKTKVLTALFDAVHDVKRRFDRRSGSTEGFSF